jgi:hypothetical protein
VALLYVPESLGSPTQVLIGAFLFRLAETSTAQFWKMAEALSQSWRMQNWFVYKWQREDGSVQQMPMLGTKEFNRQ